MSEPADATRTIGSELALERLKQRIKGNQALARLRYSVWSDAEERARNAAAARVALENITGARPGVVPMPEGIDGPAEEKDVRSTIEGTLNYLRSLSK